MLAISKVIDSLGAHPLATLFGLGGLACQLLWPLFRSRQAILTVQFGIGSNYCLQYLLLDAWSGVGVTSIGASQTAVAWAAKDHAWAQRLGYWFLPLVAINCVVTWAGPCSAFACSACALTMLGRLQKDTLRLRLFLLSASPFGIAYDVSVGATVALCGACVSLAISLTMLGRELAHRSPKWWRFLSPTERVSHPQMAS